MRHWCCIQLQEKYVNLLPGVLNKHCIDKQTFFSVSSFVFHRGNKIIQIWKDMK